MKIHFLGVGEACDARQPNTSLLVFSGRSPAGGTILLDCGFSVPHRYLALDPDPETLAAVWISHFHGDHFFGLPLLLLWFWESGRKHPLAIIGPPGVEAKTRQAVELAYPSLMGRFGFALEYAELQPGEQKSYAGCNWQSAYNEHSQPCLSLRLEHEDYTLFYSGDGRPTPETGSLAAECSILIHEAYGFDDTTPGHGSIGTCVEFARNAGARQLALVHMQRDIRLRAREHLTRLGEQYDDLEILLPGPGDSVSVQPY